MSADVREVTLPAGKLLMMAAQLKAAVESGEIAADEEVSVVGVAGTSEEIQAVRARSEQAGDQLLDGGHYDGTGAEPADDESGLTDILRYALEGNIAQANIEAVKRIGLVGDTEACQAYMGHIVTCDCEWCIEITQKLSQICMLIDADQIAIDELQNLIEAATADTQAVH